MEYSNFIGINSHEFIKEYISSYENYDQSLEKIEISKLIKHALNENYVPAWRALSVVDIITAIHFCMRSTECEDGYLVIHAPKEIVRAARMTALALLLQRGLKREKIKYTESYERRQAILERLVKKEELVELIYEYIQRSDQIILFSSNNDPARLDEVFEEAARRAKSAWAHIDIRLRLPISNQDNKIIPEIPSIEYLKSVFSEMYKDERITEKEYPDHKTAKYINNTLRRLRPVSAILYGFYREECIFGGDFKFTSPNYCEKLINFTTETSGLRRVLEGYEHVRNQIPGIPPIKLPAKVRQKEWELTPLPEAVMEYLF